MNRLVLPGLTLFWVVMNGLLWRSEYGLPSGSGSQIPTEVVWHKILDTPDSSGLEIRQDGRKIGFCRWIVEQSGEEEDGERQTAQGTHKPEPVEGMIQRIMNYHIHFEGSVLLGKGDGTPQRFRFSFQSVLDHRRQWAGFWLRLGQKTTWLELSSPPAQTTFTLKLQRNHMKFEQDLSTDDLRHPWNLLARLGVSIPWLGLQGMPAWVPREPPELGRGWRWQARADWIHVGRTRLRVYEVQTSFLDEYTIRFVISRAGEILQAALPGNLELVNEAFANVLGTSRPPGPSD